jgi:hypothetical protein
VTNTGSVAGAEVAQLYVSDPSAKATRPERELKGFEKGAVGSRRNQARNHQPRRPRLQLLGRTAHKWTIDPGKFVIASATPARTRRSAHRVLNEVAGPSAISRTDRDVLAQSGVRYVIVLEASTTSGVCSRAGSVGRHHRPQLEWGSSRLPTQAHEHGLKIIGATLTPYGGAGYYSDKGEQIARSRQRLDPHQRRLRRRHRFR